MYRNAPTEMFKSHRDQRTTVILFFCEIVSKLPTNLFIILWSATMSKSGWTLKLMLMYWSYVNISYQTDHKFATFDIIWKIYRPKWWFTVGDEIEKPFLFMVFSYHMKYSFQPQQKFGWGAWIYPNHKSTHNHISHQKLAWLPFPPTSTYIFLPF